MEYPMRHSLLERLLFALAKLLGMIPRNAVLGEQPPEKGLKWHLSEDGTKFQLDPVSFVNHPEVQRQARAAAGLVELHRQRDNAQGNHRRAAKRLRW